jgi:hypothetical protein
MRGQRGYVLFRDDTRIDYDPPRNTMDPRYAACKEHQLACDCREAELSEEIDEYRGEFRAVRRAIVKVLSGHPNGCKCTGCEIARLVGLTHIIMYPQGEVPF